METRPGEGVVKEEKFPHHRKPSHRHVCGEFWNLRGDITGRGRKKKKTQNTCLTATASGEVAQRLLSATSKRGLGREVQAASSVFRVTTGPECHENDLRELM